MTEHVYRQQIGYDLAGNPMYAPPTLQQAPVVQLAAPLEDIKAHPWGAYAAAGCFGLLALTVVVVLVLFVAFGLTILATGLALAMVCLTICTLVLRSMWRDYQRGK
ncbi:hypothetical protein [Streptomyces sp. NPDC052225]|uniref:hypothetical protein n=1 Tax=Streptomyces sp. NPDC052225 TaxID=3154949 RepID=UPI003448BA14